MIILHERDGVFSEITRRRHFEVHELQLNLSRVYRLTGLILVLNSNFSMVGISLKHDKFKPINLCCLSLRVLRYSIIHSVVIL